MLIDLKFSKMLAKKGMPQALFEQHFTPLHRELFLAQGVDISLDSDQHYRYRTAHTSLDEALFCVVDIETNGSKSDKHQIIEIGAVKVQNKTVVDQFSSLVYCNDISEHITEITGIDTKMTKEAPAMCEVMQAFRLFLGSSIFVAHDVKFDYAFISAMMQKCDLEELLNRKICTIDLAERTISAYRYGLSYLNNQLALYKEATHHRALSDAITATKLFKHTLAYIPHEVQNVEELIAFSKEAKRLKRPLIDPMKKEEEEH